MIDRQDKHWFKNAIIYEAHVKAFFDSNNDGMGDFAGIVSKLDYLQDLGVTALWLLPFYPSPQLDDGYDISAYREVNPAYGTLQDFRRLVRACHDRGIRLITELVINHTSDQHQWFQRARKAKKGSIYRDYYVWSDTDKRYDDARIIFVDTEKSNWAWDSEAKQYYWHRFYHHQPDLNFDNPRVLREVIAVMRHWLDMGVDGLRLDAIPYLIERDGTNCENLPETLNAIRKIRAEIDANYADRMLLAEANQWPEDVANYFGAGDTCHMCFHFPLMPRMYMAIAEEDRHPITDIMRQTPEIPENCQWAVFLRNHDELTLEMVTDRERDYLWKFYATDKRMRLNLGIRRRLAPLLNNDRRQIELMNSLLFSLTGTPIIYYGDELGMGDNVFLGDRNGVRTPMQWSPDRNGGFSRADPGMLYLPPIMDPIYGFQAVNVEAQARSASSLLNWTRRLIAMRQQHEALRRGTLRFLYPGNRKILAYIRETENDVVLCVANLSHAAQAVELNLGQYKGRVPVELLGRSAFPPIGDLSYLVTLPAYGFHWFVLPVAAEVPHWHTEPPPALPELITVVMTEGWRETMTGREGRRLQNEVLPAYIAKQRWFAAKDQKIDSVTTTAVSEFTVGGERALLLQAKVELASRKALTYVIPIAIAWDEEAGNVGWPLLPYTLARVRRRAKVGAMYEATFADSFVRGLVAAMRKGAQIEDPKSKLTFQPRAALAGVDIPADVAINRAGGEQSNTSIFIGDVAVLKLFRQLGEVDNPEIEMSSYLSGTVGFANTPKLLGTVQYDVRGEAPRTLAVMHEFVRNQGDGWAHALSYLNRIFDGVLLAKTNEQAAPQDRHAIYLEQVRTLGRRVAEMHQLLATPTDDAAFAPEPVNSDDIAAWRDRALKLLDAAFEAVRNALKEKTVVTETDVALFDSVVRRRKECADFIRAMTSRSVQCSKTRIHGDFHLGQVLVVQNDFMIIDFEGEPMRSPAERRQKALPARDVAGMLRSFDYAAWSALLRLAERDPEGYGRLVPEAIEWRCLVRAAFLESYTQYAAGTPSWPEDAPSRDRLLEFFTLDKVLYEIGYEAGNRPHWLKIPVQGLADTIDTLGQSAELSHAAE
jgi:maltose alpha-D-glucosyltransferase / alpha-amylase